jgi:hypothetical protein
MIHAARESDRGRDQGLELLLSSGEENVAYLVVVCPARACFMGHKALTASTIEAIFNPPHSRTVRFMQWRWDLAARLPYATWYVPKGEGFI